MHTYLQQRLAPAFVFLCLISVAARAGAFSTGITTLSFADPSKGCNNCHSGGTTPQVSLTGPAVLAPGMTAVYTLQITNPPAQLKGGLNVSSLDGTLSTGGSDAANTQTLTGAGGRAEVTHSSPKSSAMGVTTFTFQWTAPPGSYGSAVLNGWGNAVNGNGNNSGDQAAPACVGVLSQVTEDGFKLYKAKTAKTAPKFVSPPNVTLTDQFETNKVTVVAKPARLGNPVTGPGGGFINPTIHLECYKAKDFKGQAKFPGHQVQVTNQFCAQTLNLTKLSELCVPSLTDPAMAPPNTLPPNNVDHFKCYKAKIAKGFPKFVARDLTLTDDFETAKVMTVSKPVEVCNPVDKNGEGIHDPSLHLVCYQIKDAKGQAPFVATTVFTGNQFGPAQTGPEQLTASKASLLCMPSTKIDLGPIP